MVKFRSLGKRPGQRPGIIAQQQNYQAQMQVANSVTKKKKKLNAQSPVYKALKRNFSKNTCIRAGYNVAFRRGYKYMVMPTRIYNSIKQFTRPRKSKAPKQQNIAPVSG